MAPTLYTVLPALPRLPNGKLDRLALPEPDLAARQEDYVAPATSAERRLAQIFADVLGLDAVGRDDNFFSIGGHSLLATQVISRIRQTFAADIDMSTLFEAPVVRELARVVDREAGDGMSALFAPIPVADRDKPIPLSHLQERLWFVHRHMEEQGTSYNGTIGLRLRGPLSIDALRAAFQALVARHETLRTIFRVPHGGSEPAQVILRDWSPELPVRAAVEADIYDEMDRLAGHVYDLENGPLFILRMLRLAEDDHVLLIGMHHMIYDAWSQFNVMSRDVQALYTAHLAGRPANLPALPIHYADYAVWQRAQDFSRELAYWKEKLAGYSDGVDLPYDYARPSNRNWRAATYSYRYPDTLAKAFARFNQSHGATLFIGLLLSVAIVLGRYSGREDICIGTTTAGRNRVELEDLIGFFINILPLRLDLSGNPDIPELMRRARRVVLDAFENQAIPFEHVLNMLQKQRDSSQIPLVPVVLRHQNYPVAARDSWNDDLRAEVIERDERSTPNELDLQFFGDGAHLEVTVEYAAQLFSQSTVRRLIKHHQRVIEFMIETIERETQPA
jgi:acyl carrier protein